MGQRRKKRSEFLKGMKTWMGLPPSASLTSFTWALLFAHQREECK